MARKRVNLVHTPEDEQDFNDKERQQAATRGQPKKKKRVFKASQKSASYRIGEKVIERVNRTAKKHNVNKSDLVRFLLEHAIDMLEEGHLEIEYAEAKGPRNIRL